MPGSIPILVCLSIGVVILGAYRALMSLLGLVGASCWQQSLTALLLVFVNAFVVGFALGYCPPVCLYLMVKMGLIDRREPSR